MLTKHHVPSLIDQVARLAIVGRILEARALLTSLDHESILTERQELRARIWTPGQQRKARPLTKAKRKPPTPKVALQVFRRDKFICRYAHCQRRTISPPVLQELSKLFPVELPYHKNWKFASCHILYWVYATSIEHKLSFPHGGDSSETNLITACYCCNDAKNYLHLDDLAWEITDSSDFEWDGLESLLPQLKRIGIDDNQRKPKTLVATDAPSSRTKTKSRQPTQPIAPEQIKVGSLIRACLPGKQTVRAYRVEAIDLEESLAADDALITLREMWRAGPSRIWVASKHSHQFKAISLTRLDEVLSSAPKIGSH